MSNYISDYLRQSVEAKDLSNIRGALLGIIDKNPKSIDVEELQQAISYVKAQGIIGLFEANDSELDDTARNEDYYYVLSSLKQNFSQEKLDRVLLLGAKKKTNREQEPKSENQRVASRENNNNSRQQDSTIGRQGRNENHPIRAGRIVAAILILLALIAVIFIIVKILTK